jgi:type VI protein secretion system component Hcp
MKMKKLFILAMLLFCVSFFAASQQGIYLLADGLIGSRKTIIRGSVPINSFGTGVACGECTVTPGTTTSGKVTPQKIVFNLSSTDPVLITIKKFLFQARPNGTATFIFSKLVGGVNYNYYYIQLKNYTVLEIAESGDGDPTQNVAQVSLGFSSLTWTSRPSSSTPPVSYGWDFSTNAPVANPNAIPSGL